MVRPLGRYKDSGNLNQCVVPKWQAFGGSATRSVRYINGSLSTNITSDGIISSADAEVNFTVGPLHPHHSWSAVIIFPFPPCGVTNSRVDNAVDEGLLTLEILAHAALRQCHPAVTNTVTRGFRSQCGWVGAPGSNLSRRTTRTRQSTLRYFRTTAGCDVLLIGLKTS